MNLPSKTPSTYVLFLVLVVFVSACQRETAEVTISGTYTVTSTVTSTVMRSNRPDVTIGTSSTLEVTFEQAGNTATSSTGAVGERYENTVTLSLERSLAVESYRLESVLLFNVNGFTGIEVADYGGGDVATFDVVGVRK